MVASTADREDPERLSEELSAIRALVANHRDAYRRLESVCEAFKGVELDPRPDPKLFAVCEAAGLVADAALLALCARPALENQVLKEKAEYLLCYLRKEELLSAEIEALVRSMARPPG